jgi:hypothetical protein
LHPLRIDPPFFQIISRNGRAEPEALPVVVQETVDLIVLRF